MVTVTLLSATLSLSAFPLAEVGLRPTMAMVQDALPRRAAMGVSFAPLPPAEASKLGLQAGAGLTVSAAPLAGLSGEALGLKQGDIVLKLNGEPVSAPTIGAKLRGLLPPSVVTLDIVRDGKPMSLSGALKEKPRDPGNKNYEVVYSHIVSNGQRMRTIITRPRKAGKYPALFFIQGFSPISYDFTLEGSKGDVTSLDGPILFDFANQGFVTMRIEKPGVGDSEGGPFPGLDYTTEYDIYRQALKQLKAHENVDSSNVFIFGHSMGGAFGPMVAAENQVKGLCVYGVASRTWFE